MNNYRLMHFTQLIGVGRLLPATPGDDSGWWRNQNDNFEIKLLMANRNERLPENAPGAWYVDSNCTDCDMCREIAPTVFGRNDNIGLSVVIQQPSGEGELKAAREAQAGCPTDAIGDDGDLATG
jgi:ferredoxin